MRGPPAMSGASAIDWEAVWSGDTSAVRGFASDALEVLSFEASGRGVRARCAVAAGDLLLAERAVAAPQWGRSASGRGPGRAFFRDRACKRSVCIPGLAQIEPSLVRIVRRGRSEWVECRPNLGHIRPTATNLGADSTNLWPMLVEIHWFCAEFAQDRPISVDGGRHWPELDHIWNLGPETSGIPANNRRLDAPNSLARICTLGVGGMPRRGATPAVQPSRNHHLGAGAETWVCHASAAQGGRRVLMRLVHRADAGDQLEISRSRRTSSGSDSGHGRGRGPDSGR